MVETASVVDQMRGNVLPLSTPGQEQPEARRSNDPRRSLNYSYRPGVEWSPGVEWFRIHD